MSNIENAYHKGTPSFPDPFNHQIIRCWDDDAPTSDYITLVALNEHGQALVIEDLTANSAWGSWHLVSGLITDEESPIVTSQRRLLEMTGYRSNNWLYLGSFMLDAGQPHVAGHYFVARDAHFANHPPHINDSQFYAVRWISQRQLKYGLLDGRIGIMNYAFTAAMALLLLPMT